MSSRLPDDSLSRLDRAIDAALAEVNYDGLHILGYGEISAVVGWTAPDGRRVACKRLPLFDTEVRVAAYRECFNDYLARLAAGGVSVIPSDLQMLRRADGRVAVYCIQPQLEAAQVGPRYVADCDPVARRSLFERIMETINRCVNPRLGIDGQLSNWALDGETLLYLDVTTPMMRTEDGAERLDLELFLASVPWAMRGLVRGLFLGAILDKYYCPRGAVLDLIANLYKERRESCIAPFIESAGRVFGDHPITAGEVRKYYRDDARMWALLQRLRRLDRFYQRRIRRRVYPFLLPGRIERYV